MNHFCYVPWLLWKRSRTPSCETNVTTNTNLKFSLKRSFACTSDIFDTVICCHRLSAYSTRTRLMARYLGLIHLHPFRIREESSFCRPTQFVKCPLISLLLVFISLHAYILLIFKHFQILHAEYTLNRFVTATSQYLPAKRPSRIKNISSHCIRKYHSRVVITELLQLLLRQACGRQLHSIGSDWFADKEYYLYT